MARIFTRALFVCLVLCLLGAGAILAGGLASVAGLAVDHDLIETVAAWLMVPITIVSALWLAAFALAWAALPFAHAIERVRRRMRR